MGGAVTPGGFVGDTIAGPAGVQAFARLTAIGVLGAVMLAPSFALAVSVLFGRLALYVYVVLVVGLRAVGRMYRSKEDAQARSVSRLNGSRASADFTDMDDAQSQNHLRTLSASDLVPQGSGYTFVPPTTGQDLGGSIVSTAPRTSEDEPESYSPPAPQSSELDLDEFHVMDTPVSERDAALSDVEYEPATNGNGAGQNGQDASNGKFNRFWESSQAVAAPPAPEVPASPSNGSNANGNGNQEIMPYFGGGSSTWAKPPMSVLQDIPDQGISKVQIAATADSIKRALSEYGIEVEIGQVSPGPTVTMYGLIPGWVRRYKQVKKTDELGRPVLDDTGKQVVTRVEQKTRVKVDSIISREKDLSLALKTPSIRIETPVMGQSQLGIEVPNAKASPVTLRSVMESDEFKRLKGKADLPVAFGKGSGGETVVIDLAKMPHLLIAGATGSGKSVCLNAIISCLIMEKSPAELRLLLVDPKRVELTPYNGVPHLLTPVVVESEQVIGLLKGMIREMMDRYRRMEEVSVRNIDGFNKRFPENKMPFMVIVVDELADLMMTAAFEVEQAFCRLAQLGRATGIHLIIATQRPSVDVVTGLIKANFPSRASFAVTSHIDSRTILDTTGAEKLLGRGDMLYMPIDASRPERIQGVFISDKEIENLVNF
ncbi:MAG: DNA translocase FtsK, partial [Chloroflexi bacterium]|nr:DNA translocase FtsK [Chloroflexota bacterium]